MTPEQSQRLTSLLSEALKLSPELRSAFVEKACGDASIQQALLRIIHQTDPTTSMLQPLVDEGDGTYTFQPGELVLKRFRILRFIGRGGMGEVYEAEDGQLGRVALKTVRREVARFPHVMARFHQEIQLARKVTDLHVCRIHELFQSDDKVFLTMEYLEGETLVSRVRRDGPIANPEAREIALQLCSALEAAHQAGVIHRDFKSGNIMLAKRADGSLRAVVTDFGLAREIRPQNAERLTVPGVLIGTPAYMAPEQLEGAEVGPATDLYALGVVLYEMVTGKLPFANHSPVAAAVERLKGPRQLRSMVPGLPVEWDRTIARCLEYEVGKRPKSAAEVAARLKGGHNYLSALDVRQLPKLAIAGLIVAVLALAAGILFRFKSQQGYHTPSPEVLKWYSDGVTALREGTYSKAARALERSVQLDAGFVLAHARLADALTELDYTGKAKDEMLRASTLEGLRGLPDMDRQYVDAVRATITNDYARALQLYKTIFAALPPSTQPYGRLDIGRALEKDGKIQQAIEMYSDASKQASEYPAAFLRLGILQGRLGNSQEAEAAFAKAEALYRASSNIEGIAEVNYQRGDVAAVQGRLKLARSYSDQVLQATRALGNQQLEIRALLQLSGIQQREGETEEAEHSAQHAISMARENGIGLFWSTQGLVLLANTYLVGGKFGKAEPYYLEAIDLARRNQSKRLEAFAALNLGSLRERQGRTDEVIALETIAYEYYRDRKHVPNSSKARNLMGRALLSKGELDRALQLFKEQLRVGQAINDPDMIAHAEEDIGQTLEKQERFPEALDSYRAAKQAGQDLGPGFVAFQSNHLASTLARLGRFAEIQHELEDMLSAQRAQPELVGEVAGLRGRIALEKLEFRQAARFCGQAIDSTASRSSTNELDLSLCSGLASLRLGKVPDAARILQRTAVLNEREHDHGAALAIAEMQFRLNRFAEAESVSQNVAEEARRLGQKESEWQASYLLARIYLSKESRKAAAFAKTALDILDAFPHNWTTQNSTSYLARPDVQVARTDLVRLCQKGRK